MQAGHANIPKKCNKVKRKYSRLNFLPNARCFLSRTDHTGVAHGVFLEFHWLICPEALSVRTDLVWVGWSEHRVHLKNNMKEY